MSIDLLITGLAIAILLFLSGFFSGSETALTAASRAKMHQQAQDGDARARRVNRLRENKERLIGAILLGNNLVNILASALATSLLLGLVGEAAVPIATVVMTLLVLIFSEVLPKTYAINNAERMALAVAPILRWMVFLLAPITLTINAIVGFVLRLLGVRSAIVSVTDYVDELRGAIELHRSGGDSVDPTEVDHERRMLKSILDLGDVDVSEIMVHRRNLVAIDADLPPSEIVRAVMDSRYTRMPLWRDDPDNVIAVLHAKDVLRAVQDVQGDLDQIRVADIAIDPWFIPDTTTLLDQLQAFRERREHFALVVDEYGSLQGVVTLEDILEEIVGDISDEHDLPVPGVRRQPDGTYVVDGSVTIRDLNRRFEWRLPDEEASTIAGLVLHEAQRIPDVGQVFTFHGFTFEILQRHRNRISRLKIEPPPRIADPDGD